MNPRIDDDFLDINLYINDYLNQIIRTYKEISKKKFIFDTKNFKYKLKISKSTEIIYGLRNFIGNANKFSKDEVKIILTSDKKYTEIIIKDDGPGFPKDLIEKFKLGEPYIRSASDKNISKYGLGLGTFIGKTLLEKNYANISFANSEEYKGAVVRIKWENKNHIKI